MIKDHFWEAVKAFIPTSVRSKAFKALEEAGMDRQVELPGLGVAEREGRRIITKGGKEFDLTPAMLNVVINIASMYPSVCPHRQALRGIRSYYGGVDRPYLRVVISKIKSLYPELKDHIRSEKWAGYRWVE